MLAKPALPFVDAQLLTSLCSDKQHAIYTLQRMHNMQEFLCTLKYAEPLHASFYLTLCRTFAVRA